MQCGCGINGMALTAVVQVSDELAWKNRSGIAVKIRMLRRAKQGLIMPHLPGIER